MSEFKLGQFLTRVVDYSLSGFRGASTESMPKSQSGQESFSKNLMPKPQPQTNAAKPMAIRLRPVQNMTTNHLESLDKALYVKDLMNLPKDMKELLAFVQKNFNTSKESASLLTSSLSLNQLALFLQQNGKEALNKLIMTMSSASKQGMDDLSMMKETMRLINQSVSVAEQNNPSSVLKSLMLLYLPWLPVQDSVGFELEIESSEAESQSSESSISIMISTKNYGNLKATLVLLAGNSITVLINCSDTFPKEELLKRIKSEDSKHSVQSNVIIEQNVVVKDSNSSQQAKINVSNDSMVNPFLVLMAHFIIKNVIEIDNSGS